MEPRSFTTPDGLQVEIRVGSGLIEIEPADTTETILSIEGERDGDQFRIEFGERPEGGHRLVVEEQKRKGFVLNFSRDVRIHVRCPVATSVDASSGSADLQVRGRVEAIAFRSGSGDLQFVESDGNVVVKSGSGDVQGGHVRGDLVVNTASGDVQVRRVERELVARTASGDVQVGSGGSSVQVATASGDVTIDAISHGEATLRSVSGDVQVGVERGTKVWLDLSSVSGDTRSDLDMSDGPGEGEAALELRASTVSGDVHVRSARSSAGS
jgi:putative adhesin